MLAHSGALEVLTEGPKGPFLPKTGPNWEKSSGGQTWGQIWSQLPQIGPTDRLIELPHTLAWYWASSGPQGTPKGPVLALNAPFRGPRWTRRVPGGQIWSQRLLIGLPGLQSLYTTHFGLVLDPFLAPRGPKRARFGPKCALGRSWRDSEGPREPDLVPTATDCCA